MDVRCLVLKSLLVAAALNATAAIAQPPAPAPASAPSATMLIHCSYGTWPTRDQVARHLRLPSVTVGEVAARGVDAPASSSEAPTSDDVRQLQQFIRRQGRHACEHGASHVQVDFHPPRGRRVAVLGVGEESS
ncbi:hypothetical protein ACFQZQ_13130 [Lysobacter koreensis]|uniref:Uncharacterized protein n=1 Tax=Lysobacter koreensis TaxID=266122 RepID=A0ABW2YQD0_9GAMM